MVKKLDVVENLCLEAEVSLLWAILRDIRKETLKGVEKLTKEQLFIPPMENEAPIGAYLMHIAEAETYWLEMMSGLQVSDKIKQEHFCNAWFDCENPNPPKEPLEPAYYVKALTNVRNLLQKFVLALTDSDLTKSFSRTNSKGETYEITFRWVLYHLIEHEVHHRGQIFFLMRKAKFK
ncbi:DinB family protein [bacterium]|nr:DinB family protein [bacterium]